MAKNNSSSKPVGPSSASASGSSFAELFGPNTSSSSPSASLFSSVFGPPSTGKGRESTHHNAKPGLPAVSKEESSKYSYCQQEKVDHPCYYTSSIYYGGQDEVYCPSTRPTESLKDEQVDEDPNSALRGNWWQGIWGELPLDSYLHKLCLLAEENIRYKLRKQLLKILVLHQIRPEASYWGLFLLPASFLEGLA